MVLSASLIAIIGIVQYLSSSSLGLPATSPNASLFVNKNYAGAFMDLATPAAFLLLLGAEERRSRMLRATAFFLCLSYSLITLSRGHWLALAAALILLLLLFPRQPRLRRWLQMHRANQYAAGAVMLLAPLVLLVPSLMVKNIIDSTTVTAQLADNASATQRLGFYRNTLQMIGDHPWSGIGPGAFYTGFQDYYANPVTLNVATELVGIAHAHNDYLQYLAELGIPGGIATIVLVLGFLYAGWRAAATATSAQTALTGAAFFAGTGAILAHAMVDFPLSQPVPAIYLWTWAGAISNAWRRNTASTGTLLRPPLRRLLAVLAGLYLVLVSFHGYRSIEANLSIRQATRAVMKKQCDRALPLADEAFGLAPDEYLIWHHYLLIGSYCDPRPEGRYMIAEMILERAPNHPYALLLQANLLYQAGRLAAAATRYRRLTQLLPHRVSGYLGLANIAIARGDEEQASRHYIRARKLKARQQRNWYAGPAGRTLALWAARLSGDAAWLPEKRKPGLSLTLHIPSSAAASSGTQ